MGQALHAAAPAIFFVELAADAVIRLIAATGGWHGMGAARWLCLQFALNMI